MTRADLYYFWVQFADFRPAIQCAYRESGWRIRLKVDDRSRWDLRIAEWLPSAFAVTGVVNRWGVMREILGPGNHDVEQSALSWGEFALQKGDFPL